MSKRSTVVVALAITITALVVAALLASHLWQARYPCASDNLIEYCNGSHCDCIPSAVE